MRELNPKEIEEVSGGNTIDGIAGATVWMTSKYNKRFWDDFHAGIKRNHFNE